ncbi:MAG: ABC transporter ATP-binding protein [Candidatus Omnitrophota bacterium]
MKLKSLILLFCEIFSAGIKKNRMNIVWILSLTLAASVFGIISPHLLQDFIDHLISKSGAPLTLDYFTVFAFIGSLILFWGFWVLQISIATKFSCDLFYEARQNLVATVLKKSTHFFGKYKTADVISRIISDLDFVENFFYTNIISGLTFLICSFIVVFFIVLWHWKLGLILCCSLVLYAFFLTWLYEKVFPFSQKAREGLTAQNEVVLDLIHGFREIKIFQQHRNALDRLAEKARGYQNVNRNFWRYSDSVFITSRTVGLFVSSLPIFMGGYLLVQNDASITLGTLVAYYAYSIFLLDNLQYSLEGLNKIFQCSAPLVRIKELFDYPEESIESKDLKEFPADTAIELKNVSFKYKEGKSIFTNFNLRIGQNEKIAIIGTSGSGKSTLLNLLIGFLLPDSGQILFGGKETTSYPRGIYFNYFSYIPQSNYMFKISIKDNIAMGWYNVPLEQIKKAARLLKLDKFIEHFPGQYDTILDGDRVFLSGGQVQRIALSRALLRGSQILLLDEFTSALDETTEKELMDDLFEIFRNKTIICATHSRKLASHFERVLEL